MVGSLVPFACSAPLASDKAPEVKDCFWNITVEVMQCVFDLELQPGVSIPANWILHYNGNQWWPVGPLTVDFNGVVGGFRVISPSAKPNVVDYFATPPDLVGVNGIPVEAFADVPITVVTATRRPPRARKRRRRS